MLCVYIYKPYMVRSKHQIIFLSGLILIPSVRGDCASGHWCDGYSLATIGQVWESSNEQETLSFTCYHTTLYFTGFTRYNTSVCKCSVCKWHTFYLGIRCIELYGIIVRDHYFYSRNKEKLTQYNREIGDRWYLYVFRLKDNKAL